MCEVGIEYLTGQWKEWNEMMYLKHLAVGLTVKNEAKQKSLDNAWLSQLVIITSASLATTTVLGK